MSVRSLFLLVAAVAITPFSSASIVTAVGSGTYSTAAIWSNNAAPGAGNDYVIGSGFTPEATRGTTLAGDSIRIDSGGTLSFLNNTTGSGTNVVPNLTLNGGTLQMRMIYNSTGGGNLGLTGGALNVAANSAVVLNSTGRSASLVLGGAITGSGNLAVSSAGTSTAYLHRLYITSANNGYTGNWTVSAPIASVSLTANAANALGTGTVTVGSGARLGTIVANGLDSLSGIYLTGSPVTLADNDYLSRFTSLDLNTFAWTNTNAFLNISGLDSKVYLGTASSSIGELIIGGNHVATGTYTITQLNDLGYGTIFSGSTGTLTVAAVPEPSVYGLLGAGALAATALARRSRKRA